MEKKLIVGGFALLGLVALVPASARGDDTSNPGKHVAASSTTSIEMSADPWPALGVRLEKGKRKHLLRVDAFVSEFTVDPAFLFATMTVNGVDMEPSAYNNGSMIFTSCEAYCTLSGTWWLDLDTADLMHPGEFIKVPLNITMRAHSTGPSNGKMSLIATLVKK